MSLMFLGMAASAGAKDIKKVVFTTTPQMHCENCETKIKGNLRFEKGVKDISTDIESQSVTVSYDAEKTDVNKLKAAFTKFGYKAEVKPSSQQRGVKVRATKEKGKKSNECDGVTSSTQQAEKQK